MENKSPQYWKENSIAIHDSGKDRIVEITSSAKNWDERIVLKIKECDLTNPKTIYEAVLLINEVDSLIAMLTDISTHYKQMGENDPKEKKNG